MDIHEIFIRLIESKDKERFRFLLKGYRTVTLKPEDYELISNPAILILKESHDIFKRQLESPFPTDLEERKKYNYERLKMKILLSVGTEYLLKAICLKEGYSHMVNFTLGDLINNLRNVYGIKPLLEEYDRLVDEENREIIEENRRMKIGYQYVKMNSDFVLILLLEFRNNYLHIPESFSLMNGFFKDSFKFINFLSTKIFGIEIIDAQQDS